MNLDIQLWYFMENKILSPIFKIRKDLFIKESLLIKNFIYSKMVTMNYNMIFKRKSY
jgi:hypothetical protein